MSCAYKCLNHAIHDLYRFVRSGYFSIQTGIAQNAVASIIDSGNGLMIYFTPAALEKRVDSWLNALRNKDNSIDFQAKILGFWEYCNVFQSRCIGRHPGAQSLIDHVRKRKEDIFGSSSVYEGVQFFESCKTLTEVDLVAPGMLVKVDEPLRQARYRSEHRARKHRSMRKAQEFLARHNYPYCRAVRLEGMPIDDDCWEISLINTANGECLAYQRTEPNA